MSTPLRLSAYRIRRRAERRIDDLELVHSRMELTGDQYQELEQLRADKRQARDAKTLPWVPAVELALAKRADAAVAARRKVRAAMLKAREVHPRFRVRGGVAA